MKQSHHYQWQLPSKTVSAGAVDTIEGKLLPKTLFGQICHHAQLNITVDFTPTYTTAPTFLGNNNVYTKFDFFDGSLNRFTGGLANLRNFERYALGKNINADADQDTASAAQRTIRRTMHAGPPNYAGSDSDFAIPCGMLDNAEWRLQCGALTDISADTTVLTGTLRTTSGLVLLPAEARIPPVYERKVSSATGSDTQLQGRALYDAIFLTDTDQSTIAAGDVAAINLDLGQGLIVPGINAKDVLAMFLADKAQGDFSNIMGEPSAAGDDNVKQVNRASPTALVGAIADLQPVLWSPPDAMMTKRPIAESSARLYWGGTDTAMSVYTAKFLPQGKSAIGAAIAKTFAKLPFKPKTARVKTLSKKPYDGPYVEFMPWIVEV